MPRPSLFNKKNKIKKRDEPVEEQKVDEPVEEQKVDVNDYTYGNIDVSQLVVSGNMDNFTYEAQEVKEEPKKPKRKKRKNKKPEEPKPEEPKVEEPKVEEPSALNLLEQLRNEKNIVRTVEEPPQVEEIKEEKPKSTTQEAYLLSNKNYIFEIDTNEQEENSQICFYNDKNSDLKLFGLIYNKMNNQVIILDGNKNGDLLKKSTKRLNCRDQKLKIIIKLNARNIKVKIGNTTTIEYIRNINTSINKCDWTMKNLTLL